MGVGERVAQEAADICMLVADSRCCTAETNILLQSNYPLIFFFLKGHSNKQIHSHPWY